ncbi:MAG TPA: T9SS type A sorting domain-containing protein [Chitinophagaceae bacterium]|nr:T9SS type A sorting domain-containing protein [Chitinophagaceae bacterium]
MNIQAKAYPDPFTSRVGVDVVAEEEQQIIFRMYNQNNNLIKMSYWNLLKGSNKIIIDNVQNLSAGIYTLALQNDSNEVLYEFKLTKQ